MEKIVFQVEQEFDGGFVANAIVTESEHIVTQGDTVQELKFMIEQALNCHFESISEMPKTVILNFTVNEEN